MEHGYWSLLAEQLHKEIQVEDLLAMGSASFDIHMMMMLGMQDVKAEVVVAMSISLFQAKYAA